MKLKKNILPLIFISLFFYAVIGSFHSAISFNWSLQDWLINYQGGFVRRGLSGEFILVISDIFFNKKDYSYFGNQIHLPYFFILTFFYFIFYTFLYFFLRKENFNFQNLFIILSPLSVPFIIYNIGAIGRKEIIFFITFLSFVFIINFLKKKELSIIFLIFLLPLVLLLHEGLIFFLTFFLILYIFEINKENRRFIFVSIFILVFLCIGIFILITIYRGNPNVVDQICLSLGNYPIKDCYGLSAIGMLSDTETFSALWSRIFADKYLLYYPLFSIIAFFPLIKISNKYCFNFFINDKVYKFNFLVIFAIFLINTLPLYIFTHDWGRWLNITYILFMISFFHLRKLNKIFLKSSETDYLENSLNVKKGRQFILSIILIFYSLILSVSYFGGYTYWLYNYSNIDDYLIFCLNFLKTIPYLF